MVGSGQYAAAHLGFARKIAKLTQNAHMTAKPDHA
jgi:hypothetical protein